MHRSRSDVFVPARRIYPFVWYRRFLLVQEHIAWVKSAPKPVADAIRSYNHRHTGAKRSCRSASHARLMCQSYSRLKAAPATIDTTGVKTNM